ncbi:Wzz/FepE/Etk N-terminal domain-containing protein [Candidatus Accumulibacter sp. ACC003]|uniref:Wzz/FepE/Etk N-terminal domain-containing protein n=1 Tax=Candidatus Accumulibacter sp. ACC003 TaxID=2823334 RepID=UPI0025BB672E|nr:Wzz/FepE/Etk N-terminal domain-containing protein [Candidatus Accumulibacter sp. ACC003]
MSANELTQEREINLFDLWQKLRAGWRLVAGGAALGLLFAGLAMVLIAPKYEALALVQVGLVGEVTQFGPPGVLSSRPAEPVPQAIERMKTPAFQLRVARSLNRQDWIDALQRSAGAGNEFLTLQLSRDTATAAGEIPLIELRARSGSPESAREISDAAVFELAERQAEIVRPAIERLKSDLAIAKGRQQQAEQDLAALSKLIPTAAVKDDQFTQLALMTTTRLVKQAEIFSQRQNIVLFETALSAPATQPAQAIESVFVAEKPVAPKRGSLLALGFFGGLLAGIVVAFIVDARRRGRHPASR